MCVCVCVRVYVSIVRISETKMDDFYYSGSSYNCLHLYCIIHNVSADMPSGLLPVCRKREPTRNFEQHPLFSPRDLLVLIPLTITGYKC